MSIVDTVMNLEMILFYVQRHDGFQQIGQAEFYAKMVSTNLWY